MDNGIIEFEKWCKKLNIPQIRQYKNFEDMGNSLKMYIAEKLIFEYCSTVGRYMETGDIIRYIRNFVRNMKGDVDGFGGRINQPLKAALLIIANEQYSSALPSDRSDFDHICAGGAALSAMYLMARLENLFRIKSRYLNEKGTVKRGIPIQLGKQLKQLGVTNLGPNWQCNRINQSFYIFLYRNKTLLGKRLKIMNKKLKIADRLDYIRNPVMHGKLEDPSSEARFLGLLIAMFYYGA